MTEFRARIGVQAIGFLTLGFLTLALGVGAHATVTSIDITSGSQAKTDSACVAPIPFFNTLDCSYNESDPTGFAPDVWQGPTGGSAVYYLDGDSPFKQTGDTTVAPEEGDPLSVELAITGTINIEDNGTPCTADDTIGGELILQAGTRAFDGGQGALGEESWGDDDIKFPWPLTAVDSAAANGQGGCDYVIASAGFPDRLVEAAAPNRLYPVDAGVDDAGFWEGPSLVGIVTVEGNVGMSVTVTVGGGWSCVEGGTATGACDEGTGLNDGGSHFKGTREILETVMVSISTDGSGDIVSGEIFANNESAIFNVPPFPFNSWDGTRWEFTGTCGTCTLARDDNYEVVIGATDVILDIGANDSTSLVDPSSAIITVPTDKGGAAAINDSPGPIAAITATYTPLGGPHVETFTYEVSDSADQQATAVVTIDVVLDTIPVANDVTLTLDTVGVDPASLTGQFNGLTDNENLPGNNGVVTTDNASANGTDSTDGTNVTYVPNGNFFTGSDSFVYTITDDQLDTDDGTVTVNIPDATPGTPDEAAVTDENIPVDIPISPTLGNGAVDQHQFTISHDASSGICLMNTAHDTVTYTPNAEFFGDDSCTYTVADGDGTSSDGVITITVNEIDDVVIKLPGGTALGPWTLVLLLGLPLLRRRRHS